MKLSRTVFICWLLLSLLATAWGTDERPTIGFETKAPLQTGQAVRLLVNHASYPRLEDFLVSVTYQPVGPLPRTEVLGHPDALGVVNWTPSQAGPVLIKAVAPGPPPLEISRSFRVEGAPVFPTWSQLFGLGLGLLLLLWLLRQARLPKPVKPAESRESR